MYEYLASGKMVKRLTVPDPEFISQLFGRTENDLFLAMRDGICHYNGTNIQYIYKFPFTGLGVVNDPMIFEKDLFFCILNMHGSYNTTNLILHGILKEEGD